MVVLMTVMMKMQQKHAQSRTKMMLSPYLSQEQELLNISMFSNLSYELS